MFNTSVRKEGSQAQDGSAVPFNQPIENPVLVPLASGDGATGPEGSECKSQSGRGEVDCLAYHCIRTTLAAVVDVL